MKLGDLVKLRCPTTRDFNKVFLVTERRNSHWIKVIGSDGWQATRDYEVIHEGR